MINHQLSDPRKNHGYSGKHKTLTSSLLIAFFGIFLTSCDSQKDAVSKESFEVELKENQPRGGKRTVSRGDEEVLKSFRTQVADHSNVNWEDVKASVRALSDNQLNILLDEFSSERNSPKNRGQFVVLVKELASRDPEAALSMYNPLTMVGSEAGWFEVAAVLAENSPALLKNWLIEKLPDAKGSVKVAVMYSGVSAMTAHMDPNEVLDFYNSNISGKFSIDLTGSLISDLFQSFAKKNPEQAANAALGSLKGRALDTALSSIASQIMASDPDRAFQLAEKLEDRSSKIQTLAMLYRQLADNDLEGAISKFENVDRSLLPEIFRGDEFSYVESLSDKIAKNDPSKLIEIMNSITISESTQGIFTRAVGSLVSAGEGGKALELIESMPKGALHDSLFGEYLGKMVSVDPVSALENFGNLPQGNDRELAFSKLGEFAGQKKGFDGSLETLQNNISEADKPSFLSAAMPSMIHDSPEKAAAFLSSADAVHLVPEAREKAMVQLGRTLAAKDLAEATKWVDGLSVEDQPQAIQGYARELTKSNVEKLVDFLSEIPKNEAWASGVRVLAKDLQKSDPESAAAWQSQLDANGFGEKTTK